MATNFLSVDVEKVDGLIDEFAAALARSLSLQADRESDLATDDRELRRQDM
jgi:hypothetical protein